MSLERNPANSTHEADLRLAVMVRTVVPYIADIEIRSVRRKGLRRLVESDATRGVRRDLTGRIRGILAVLITAVDMEGVAGPPGWRIHLLSGHRAGSWSISASGNWRITFAIEHGAIANLNLEVYR